MKKIAVVGCKLTTDNATATAEIVDSPSQKVNINKNGVYITPLTVIVSGATQGGFSQTSPVFAKIISSAEKVKVDNKLVILEGDKTQTPAQCPAVDSNGSQITILVNVIIQSAGQEKISAN